MSALQPEGLVPQRVVDTSNRRSAGLVYMAGALCAVLLIVATGVDLLWLTGAGPLLALGGYHLIAGRRLQISDREAIEIASTEAPFDVGHGSSTLGFAGIIARPVWEVLVFETGAAPSHQALVTVDALTGEVTGLFSEPVDTP